MSIEQTTVNATNAFRAVRVRVRSIRHCPALVRSRR